MGNIFTMRMANIDYYHPDYKTIFFEFNINKSFLEFTKSMIYISLGSYIIVSLMDSKIADTKKKKDKRRFSWLF